MFMARGSSSLQMVQHIRYNTVSQHFYLPLQHDVWHLRMTKIALGDAYISCEQMNCHKQFKAIPPWLMKCYM